MEVVVRGDDSNHRVDSRVSDVVTIARRELSQQRFARVSRRVEWLLDDLRMCDEFAVHPKVGRRRGRRRGRDRPVDASLGIADQQRGKLRVHDGLDTRDDSGGDPLDTSGATDLFGHVLEDRVGVVTLAKEPPVDGLEPSAPVSEDDERDSGQRQVERAAPLENVVHGAVAHPQCVDNHERRDGRN